MIKLLVGELKVILQKARFKIFVSFTLEEVIFEKYHYDIC